MDASHALPFSCRLAGAGYCSARAEVPFHDLARKTLDKGISVKNKRWKRIIKAPIAVPDAHAMGQRETSFPVRDRFLPRGRGARVGGGTRRPVDIVTVCGEWGGYAGQCRG